MQTLGIDIGGSGIKGTIVDTDTGQFICDRIRFETPQPSTPQAVAAVVKKMVNHFNYSGIVGCGFPSAIQNGTVKTAANIDHAWIGTRVEQLFYEATGCKCFVVNDADAAGIAEMKFGVGKNFSGEAILVTIGTGIGSVIFHNNMLVPNTELGHLILHGKIAEKYASDAARKNKHLTWKQWALRFNEYLNLLYRYFYPEMIIVGGGASKKFDKFKDFLNVPCEIQPAMLRNQAGLIGAALYAASKVK